MPGRWLILFPSIKRVEKIAEKTIIKSRSPPLRVKLVRIKIVKDHVVNFWQALNVFNPNQFGFLEGKSTLTQLLCCFDDWASSRNKSRPTDVIFLDFSKAFDSVPHERLLLKLKCHRIEGSLLHWFRSFLTDRKQRVVVRGTH